MRYLFIHHSFPGQFWHLVQALARDEKNTVVFISTGNSGQIPNVRRVIYTPARGAGSDTHSYVRYLENGVYHGQAVAQCLTRLKQQGFIPDVIYGHYGWGVSMFVRDVLPETPFLGYFEWFYNDRNGYVGATTDPQALSNEDKSYLRLKNTPIWVTLQACDRAVTPTYWQRSQFPEEFQDKFTVVHDGIDSELFRPVAGAKLVLPDIELAADAELVTFVARSLEPGRGFFQFIEALDMVLKERPYCHAVIVGNDQPEYNRPLADGKTYKQLMLERFSLDLDRVHFTGWLEYDQYRRVLQAATVHVYLTYPFILSWSLTEALACGCLVVASDTGPVREVIKDGQNGFLADVGSPQAIARRIIDVLANCETMGQIRLQARKSIVQSYSIAAVLPRQVELLNGMAGEKASAAAIKNSQSSQ